MSTRLLLDPWAPEYESPVAFDGEGAARTGFQGEVDVHVETADWAAVPADADLPWSPERACFVDGVRRVEARVLAEDTGGVVHGMLASLGAGAVVCCEGAKAAYDSITVERWLLLGSGKAAGLDAGNGVRFAPCSIAGSGPEELIGALQELMRTREAEIAAGMAGEGACVFADGPLSYHTLSSHRVTGVIKRIFLTYLDHEHMRLVSALQTAERTPVFAILDGKYDRYSWFQRLAPRRESEHGLAGIVRLEVRASLGIDAAVEIASFASRALPHYASSAVRDARAPQNLLPIGALETELRHRLGDALLIRRAVERAIADGVDIIEA